MTAVDCFTVGYLRMGRERVLDPVRAAAADLLVLGQIHLQPARCAAGGGGSSAVRGGGWDAPERGLSATCFIRILHQAQGRVPERGERRAEGHLHLQVRASGRRQRRRGVGVATYNADLSLRFDGR